MNRKVTIREVDLMARALLEQRFFRNTTITFTFPRAGVEPGKSQASGSIEIGAGRAFLCTGMMITADAACRVFGALNQIELTNQFGVHDVDPNTGEATSGGYEVMFGPGGGTVPFTFASPVLIRELGGVSLRYIATEPDATPPASPNNLTGKTVNVSLVLEGQEITNPMNPDPSEFILVWSASTGWAQLGYGKPGMKPDMSGSAVGENPLFLGESLWGFRLVRWLNKLGANLDLINQGFGGSDSHKQFRVAASGQFNIKSPLGIVSIGSNNAKGPMHPHEQLRMKLDLAKFIENRDCYNKGAELIYLGEAHLDDFNDNLNSSFLSRNNRDILPAASTTPLTGASASTLTLDFAGAPDGTVFQLGANTFNGRPQITDFANGTVGAVYILQGNGTDGGSSPGVGTACDMQYNVNKRRIRNFIRLVSGSYIKIRMISATLAEELERGLIIGQRIAANVASVAVSGSSKYHLVTSANSQATILAEISGAADQNIITIEGGSDTLPTQIVQNAMFRLDGGEPFMLSRGKAIVFGVSVIGTETVLREMMRGNVVPTGDKTRIAMVRDNVEEVATSAIYGGGTSNNVHYADVSSALVPLGCTVEPVTGVMAYTGLNHSGAAWRIGDLVNDNNFKYHTNALFNEQVRGRMVHPSPEGHALIFEALKQTVMLTKFHARYAG